MTDFEIPVWDADEKTNAMIENLFNSSTSLDSSKKNKARRRKSKGKLGSVAAVSSDDVKKSEDGTIVKKQKRTKRENKSAEEASGQPENPDIKKRKTNKTAPTDSTDAEPSVTAEGEKKRRKRRVSKKHQGSKKNKYAELGHCSKKEKLLKIVSGASIVKNLEVAAEQKDNIKTKLSHENQASGNENKNSDKVCLPTNEKLLTSSGRKRKREEIEGQDDVAKLIKLKSEDDSRSAKVRQKETEANRKTDSDLEDKELQKNAKSKLSKRLKKGKKNDVANLTLQTFEKEVTEKEVTTETGYKGSPQKLPFNVSKLRNVLESTKSTNQKDKEKVNSGLSESHTNSADKNSPVNAKESSSKELSKKKKKKSKGGEEMSIKENMLARLSAAQFRVINEQLYTSTSDEAVELFKTDKEAFKVYHLGYQTQVTKWPTVPVNKMIAFIKKRGSGAVVADFGCGEAKIAQSVPNKVHSFDLVALNKHVKVCDMKHVPLGKASVDIAVFCLSLMGTNLIEFLCEANRVLKPGGTLLVAEVVSRFEKIAVFVKKVEKLGFTLINKDKSNTMFVWFEFKKSGDPPQSGTLPSIELGPCIYKKR